MGDLCQRLFPGNKKPAGAGLYLKLEAWVGIEPALTDLQSAA
jgi:hypothetical protein